MMMMWLLIVQYARTDYCGPGPLGYQRLTFVLETCAPRSELVAESELVVFTDRRTVKVICLFLWIVFFSHLILFLTKEKNAEKNYFFIVIGNLFISKISTFEFNCKTKRYDTLYICGFVEIVLKNSVAFNITPYSQQPYACYWIFKMNGMRQRNKYTMMGAIYCVFITPG